MLSKSSARRFFLLGTAACSAAFALLTLDTIRQVPTRTNADKITPEVALGKRIWESKNCMGCHTLMGEGAYYAPELTKVHERRGEAFIKAVLKDPEAMYPGERKMVNYKLNDDEINALTAFLKWVGEVDLNGFPAKPDLMNSAPLVASAPSKSPVSFNQMCVACHALNGAGGKIGPALDGIGARRDKDFLAQWLLDPFAVKADSRMPKLPLSDEQIRELVDFLSSALAFLLQRLHARRHRGEKLHDDGRRDVRHDVEGEDRHPAQRAAGEHVQHAQQAATLGLED
ncbi:MAG: c-type cytochrome, partial [Calothrix sp. SM1_5_4]|nr:c-type cytochrome [Calothrix sp. SM1_5_4]